MGKDEPKRIPGATYRLQFNSAFTFRDATALVPYLHDLGITDCYASPIFAAISPHGYDVCDCNTINPNIGSEAEFRSFVVALRQHQMGLMLDVVPNHMAADVANSWWFNVLEKGPASPYANYFDIDWKPLHSEGRNQVLLPVLEDHYGNVLESGKLQLRWDTEAFVIRYHDKIFPIAPHSHVEILKRLIEFATSKTLENSEGLQRLNRWLQAFESDRSSLADWQAQKRELGLVLRNHPDLGSFLKGVLEACNGTVRSPESFGWLDQLISAQNYRLAFWRIASEEINYRRFFDVNELVSLRMERADVFDACHNLVFRLIEQGAVTGLRIDHPDGLREPKEYFRRLQTKCRDLAKEASHKSPFYVVAEKILMDREELRPDWSIDGTSGYDFLNRLNGVFVDSKNEPAFQNLYGELTGCAGNFQEIVRESKKVVLENSFAGELRCLNQRVRNLGWKTRMGRDLTSVQIRRALSEIIATFPVYRTYITAGDSEVGPHDREAIDQAIAAAQGSTRTRDGVVFEYIRALLLLERFPEFGTEEEAQRREFILRFQQLTGPVTAKGVEDTAFYRYHRLISLNEVGGNPARFGNSLEDFHRDNQRRARAFPHAMLATATHDTKRGEDARARINVLSEFPSEWSDAVLRWRRLNSDKKVRIQGEDAPDLNEEYFLYQTLIGAWPEMPDSPARTTAAANGTGTTDWAAFAERIASYLWKAAREAKVHTNWTEPDTAYESAIQQFARTILRDETSATFRNDFRNFHRRIAFFGALNSLSQVLLKATSPGVPDFYQGTELWDFSLVDPDNRRPVDFETRRQILASQPSQISPGPALPGWFGELLEGSATGAVKMKVVSSVLAFRRQHRELFEHGDYIPLETTGAKREYVIAFARVWREQIAVVATPRLAAGLMKGTVALPIGASTWQDTELILVGPVKRHRLRNILTGEALSIDASIQNPALRLRELFATAPFALLEG